MGLDASTCSECLREQTTPRARATDLCRGPNLRIGSGRAHACHGAESTSKDPRPEAKKMLKGKYIYYIYVQDSPSGWFKVKSRG